MMIETDPELCVHEARSGLFLLAGGKELAGIAREISRRNIRPEMALTESLASLKAFDFVILNTAPSITELAIIAFFYANEALVPVSMEFLALDGMGAMQEELEHIKRYHDLDLRYILPAFIDRWVSKTNAILKCLQKAYGHLVPPGIRYSTRLSELPQWRQLIWEVDRQNQASADYLQLCEAVYG